MADIKVTRRLRKITQISDDAILIEGQPKYSSNPLIEYIKIRCLEKNKNYMAFCLGSTGCLSKDTVLFGQTKTIEELYQSGNKYIKTFSLNKAKNVHGTFYPVKSKSEIIYSGKKEVYEIELENGKKVIATKEHKFFRKKGHTFEEVELNDLKERNEIKDFNISYLNQFYQKANDTL